MSGYRRFVAYVYEYRKGKKESNCGFIKVEVRDVRCTMEVHLNIEGLPPGVECRIYGFVRKDGLMNGILLENCETGEDSIECLIETEALNMGDSGISLGKMGGMIFTTQTGGFFGTEWDDQPIRPANFRELKIIKEPELAEEKKKQNEEREAEEDRRVNVERITEKEKNQEEKIQAEEIREQPEYEEEASWEELREENDEIRKEDEDKSAEMEKELLGEDGGLSDDRTGEFAETEGEYPEEGSAPDTKHSQRLDELQKEDTAAEVADMEIGSKREEEPAAQHTDRIRVSEAVRPGPRPPQPGSVSRAPQPNPGSRPVQPGSGSRPPQPGPGARPPQPGPGPHPPQSDHGSRPPQPNPGSRPRPPRSFGEEYFPFDDGDMAQCWKIHPKDFHCFPRRQCALRNNRFLQYGHYNFGHLLLCRKSNGQYILGVPGSYDQQERFMANMFGFPYFKESRMIEVPKGRGGYWYRLIDAPDFH